MNIFICRHGQTDSNLEKRLLGITDENLNEQGIKEAKYLGEYLSQFSLRGIYCSSLTRARHTAEIVRSYQSSPINVLAMGDFNERNFGDYEMRKWREVFEEIPDLRKRWKEEKDRVRFPNGEVLSDFINRVKNAFSEVLSKHCIGENLLFIAHGGSIKAMLGYILKTPNEHVINLCDQDNCGINFISFDGSDYKVNWINYTSYVRGKNGI